MGPLPSLGAEELGGELPQKVMAGNLPHGAAGKCSLHCVHARGWESLPRGRGAAALCPGRRLEPSAHGALGGRPWTGSGVWSSFPVVHWAGNFPMLRAMGALGSLTSSDTGWSRHSQGKGRAGVQATHRPQHRLAAAPGTGWHRPQVVISLEHCSPWTEYSKRVGNTPHTTDV